MPTLITRNGGQMSSLNFMRLVKKVIPDGILDGCGISKSGSVITVAAGHIVACGALIEVESTSITVSSSGELVLRIDTSSETPAQIIARDSATLTQQDLTTGGTVYEFRLTSYTYSSGNVTLGADTSGSASSSSSSSSSGQSTDTPSTSLSKSGTLTSKVSSTVSSPTVHYSASYSATKNGTALSVDLSFDAWLNSSGSTLGTGIKLTIYARLNNGSWKSVVVKENSNSWSGTFHRKATLTLTATSDSNSETVDFYVTRSGSNYNGTAGTLGSQSNPKRYTFNMN